MIEAALISSLLEKGMISKERHDELCSLGDLEKASQLFVDIQACLTALHGVTEISGQFANYKKAENKKSITNGYISVMIESPDQNSRVFAMSKDRTEHVARFIGGVFYVNGKPFPAVAWKPIDE